MIIKLIVMISVSLYYVGNAFAWDDKLTHPELTKVAIEKSGLDEYLKNNLGISKGIGTKYKDVAILKLLQHASTNEDLPYRGYNHFWNPMHNEGLDDSGCGLHFVGLPNRNWAMGKTQDGQSLDDCGSGDHSSDKECNDYSWRRAREAYYESLTSTSDETRNNKFIMFYEKLGRVLHLLQDVAIPAHTRNDMFGHLDFTGFEGNPLNWGGNLFEYWVKNQLARNSDYISQQSENLLIPMFTRPENYWDNEVYCGAGPEITLPADGKERSGLAEYSNANFLSKCTMFTEDLPFGDSHYFPYPNKSSLEYMPPEIVIGEDGKTDRVRYLKKDKHGEVFEHFVQARYLWEGLYIRLTDTSKYYRLAFQLDDKVHEAYAKKLTPKTVGYTAGLINFFFRGNIEITPPDEYVYAIIDGSIESDKTQQEFKKLKAKIRNISPREKDAQGNIISYEPIGQGQLQAVAKYRIRPNYQADLSGGPPTYEVMKDVDYSYSVSAKVAIASLSTDAPEEFVFDFSENPIPVGITDLYLQVIFKGTLGNEQEIAVAVGMKDLNEPDHIVFWNNTDYFLLNGVPRKAEHIENDPNVQAYGYIYPYTLTEELGFASTSQDAFATPIVLTIQDLPPGRYSRIIVLLDKPDEVWVKDHTISFLDDVNWFYALPCAINQETEAGSWTNTPVYDVRGIIQHQMSYFIRSYPYFVYGPDAFPAPPENSLGPYPVTINFP